MANRELYRKVTEMAMAKGLTKKAIRVALEKSKDLKPQDPSAKKTSTREVRKLMKDAGKWILDIEEEAAIAGRLAVDRPLSDQVKKHCGLTEVIIPADMPYSDPKLLANTIHLCRYSADYLSNLMDQAETEGNRIGVMLGGGDEGFYTVRALDERHRPKAWFIAYAIIGRGIVPNSTHIGPESNVTYGWIRSGQIPGHLYYSTATPPDPPKPDQLPADRHREACGILRMHAQNLLEKNKPIQAMFDKMHGGNNVLIGGFGLVTGEQKHNRLTMAGLLEHYGIDMTMLKKAAGDFAYCIYDDEGRGNKDWEFILTAGYPKSVQFLKDMAAQEGNKVIGIGGADRLPAIRAALKGKLFNVLITDPDAARALLA